MKKRLIQLSLWSLAVLLLWLVVRTVPLPNVVEIVGQLHLWQLGVLILLNGLVLLSLNGRWWLILRGLGFTLPFWQLMGHRLAAFGVSYFTPGPQFGGEPVQVLLVEQQHGVPRHAAIAAVSLDKTVELLLNFGFLIIGLLVMLQMGLFDEVKSSGTAVWPLFFFLLPCLYLWLIWWGKRPFSALLHNLARRANGGWVMRVATTVSQSEAEMNTLCQQTPQAVLSAIAASALSWALLMIEFYSMVLFLSIPLTLLQLIAVLTAARVAFLLPLPGGLGTLEASQVWAFSLFGLNPAAGIGLSLLIRLRDVALGVLGVWWGSKRLKLVWIRP